MLIKIKKNACIQYLLLYMMMIFNGGVLYPVLQTENPTVLSLVMYLIIGSGIVAFCVKKRKYGNPYCMLISMFLVISVVFVRYTAGGVGISALLEFLACIMLAYLAVCIDREHFSSRMINIVCCFAAISIVCYVIQIVSPEILKLFFKSYKSSFTYNDWSAAEYGGSAVKHAFNAWGKLLYSMREGEMSRNKGIYSEPGNYQIVLNSALFILLFLPKYHSFSPKQLKMRAIILFTAVLTCQSTTGYLILLTFVIAFFISEKKYEDMLSVRHAIKVLIFVAIIALILDYSFRGNESLLNTAILSKVFNNGSIDISTSTGYWRLGAIGASAILMITHPLGVGYDITLSTIQNSLVGAAGGALMTFGAALGIIPFIATILWHTKPILSGKTLGIPEKIAFMVMYFQTSFAQTKVFYPYLVSIVVLFVVIRKDAEEIKTTNR